MKNSKISSVNRTVLDSKQVLLSARPPWHAVLFMAVSAGVLFRCLPSLEQLDEIAIVDTFTKRTFPDLVSLRMLAYIRAAIAMIVWATTVYNLVSPGWEQMTPYMKRSKLKMVPNQLTGVRTLYPFTSWYGHVYRLL